jgi:hypothetical protein
MGKFDPARSWAEDMVESSVFGMVPRPELLFLHFVSHVPDLEIESEADKQYRT